jgi:uncharacterized protein (TIGR02001 family)
LRGRARWPRHIVPALLGATLLQPDVVRSALTVDGIVRMTTNYIYRGYSKSDDHASIQGNLDALHSSRFFLGGWLSSVDFGGADVELNPYLGLAFGLSPDWRISGTLAGYLYDEQVMSRHADYGEFTARCGYRDLGALSISVAPDYLGTGHTVFNYAAELRYPLTETMEVSSALGYQVSRSAINYDIVYGNVGIAWFARRHLTLDLRYYDAHETNERVHDQAYPADNSPVNDPERRVTLSISVGF